jgi:hypothetical protein
MNRRPTRFFFTLSALTVFLCGTSSCAEERESPTTSKPKSIAALNSPSQTSNIAADGPAAADVALPISVERINSSDDDVVWTIHASMPARDRRKIAERSRSTEISKVNMHIVPPLPTVRIRDSKNPFDGTGIDLTMPTIPNLVP